MQVCYQGFLDCRQTVAGDSYKWVSYKKGFGSWWVVVGVGGYSLAGGGWWWVVLDIFWLVVGGDGYILVGGGSWWMVVGDGIV